MFFTNFLLNFNAYKKCYLMLDIKNTKGVTSRTFEHTHIYSSFIHNGFPFTSWNEFFFLLHIFYLSSSLHGLTPFMPPLLYVNRFLKQWFRIIMWKYHEKPTKTRRVRLMCDAPILMKFSSSSIKSKGKPIGKWYSVLIDFHKTYENSVRKTHAKVHTKNSML